VRRRRSPTRVVPHGRAADPDGGRRSCGHGRRCGGSGRRPVEQAGPDGDASQVTAGGAGEGAVGVDDPGGDQYRDGQVRHDHAGTGAGPGRVVVVARGLARQRQVESELPAGEDGGEAGHGVRAGAQQGGAQRDGADDGDRGRAGHDGPAGLPVRGDPEDGRDETEQHGARRGRSVGGHGPPR
jgi:hypothetical protein